MLPFVLNVFFVGWHSPQAQNVAKPPLTSHHEAKSGRRSFIPTVSSPRTMKRTMLWFRTEDF